MPSHFLPLSTWTRAPSLSICVVPLQTRLSFYSKSSHSHKQSRSLNRLKDTEQKCPALAARQKTAVHKQTEDLNSFTMQIINKHNFIRMNVNLIYGWILMTIPSLLHSEHLKNTLTGVSGSNNWVFFNKPRCKNKAVFLSPHFLISTDEVMRSVQLQLSSDPNTVAATGLPFLLESKFLLLHFLITSLRATPPLQDNMAFIQGVFVNRE